MPEPVTASEGTPTEQAASTPQGEVTPADKQTTTQPRAEETVDATTQDLMNALGIPSEIQDKIAPKEEAPAPAEAKQEPEEPDEPEEEPDEPEEPDAAATPEGEVSKPDKRQKRINRLTRQKAELEGKLDQAHQEAERLREQLQARETSQSDVATAPAKAGRLAAIATEPQLDQEIAKAETLIDWCDANAEGVTTGQGENERFVSPKEIAAWRREAEKVILLAPNRRQEIQRFNGQRQQFDTIARQAWPEIFDTKSEEHQIAKSIEQAYPFLKDLPARTYAVGLIVEGMKSLHHRIQSANGKNGAPDATATRQHRDISDKAFGPRVPIAPSTPEPPTREVVPSSKKKLNQAMSDLATEGGRENLAAALAALDETVTPDKSPSRRLVRA